jgi:hypothetical protein
MPEATAVHVAADVRSIVADARQRLAADMARIDRAVRAAPTGEPLPNGVFDALGTARRDALTAFGRLLQLSEAPARQEALAWLSIMAASLTSTYRALRAERVSPATAARARQQAQSRLRQVAPAFLALDRALGCPYGCKEPK